MKKYECNFCYTKQKIKAEQLKEKQIDDRMALGLYGKCVKCNVERRMNPSGKYMYNL